MTDIDELERKREKLSALLRIFMIVVALLGLVLVGALISLWSQQDAAMSEPSREAGSLVFDSLRKTLFA